MVKIYLNKINAGLMSVDDVPVLWREKVRAALEEQKGDNK